MTYGLEAYASNGDLLVSSDFPVYHFLGTPTQGSSSTTRNVTKRTYSISYNSSSPPMIFIDLAVGDYGAVNNFVRSGTDWLFDITGNVRDTTSKILPYGIVQTASTSGLGMQVFNASSQIMFDSFKNPLWASEFFNFPGATVLSSPNFGQINGTLTQSYVKPIFLANLLATATTPPPSLVSSIFAIKRTGTNTWQTTQFNDTSEPRTIATTITLYDVGILVCEGVI